MKKKPKEKRDVYVKLRRGKVEYSRELVGKKHGVIIGDFDKDGLLLGIECIGAQQVQINGEKI